MQNSINRLYGQTLPARIFGWSELEPDILLLSGPEVLVLTILASAESCPGLYRIGPNRISDEYFFPTDEGARLVRKCYRSLQAQGFLFYDDTNEVSLVPMALLWTKGSLTTSDIENWYLHFRGLPNSPLRADWLRCTEFYLASTEPNFVCEHFHTVFGAELRRYSIEDDDERGERLLCRVPEVEETEMPTMLVFD